MLSRLKKTYKKYINDDQYVYKMCNDEWIVIMRKLKPTRKRTRAQLKNTDPVIEIETKTNESRSHVSDPMYAKFRANVLYVIKIVNANNGGEIQEVINNNYRTTKYVVGQNVVPDHFDDRLDCIMTSGIHYFKTIEAAFYYFRSIPPDFTGKWKRWNDCGKIWSEENYINGHRVY